MKMIKMFLVLLCSVMLLVSCDNMNYTRIGGHSETLNSMKGKFDYFSGTNSKSTKVKEGEIVNVIVELNVEEGEMYVTVQDSDDNELFRTDVSDNFEFAADSDTKIKATVHAKKAGGSYKVEFEK